MGLGGRTDGRVTRDRDRFHHVGGAESVEVQPKPLLVREEPGRNAEV